MVANGKTGENNMITDNGLIASDFGRAIEIIEFPYVIKLGRDEKGIMETKTYFTAKDIECYAIHQRTILDGKDTIIKQVWTLKK